MSDNTDLQQMIDVSKEDLANIKANYESAKKANDDSYNIAQLAQAALQDQINKLDALRLQTVQSRVDGDIDIADQLDAQIEAETSVYNQLSAVSQEKWHESQLAANSLYDPEEQYKAAKKNLESLQDLQKTSNAANNSSSGSSTEITSDTDSGDTNTNTSGISVGDKVQIKVGAIDVTNGNAATAGQLYVEGGLLWATVEYVDTNWYTGGVYNLPEIVTNVKCKGADGKRIVWQVTPDMIASNIIRAITPTQKTATPLAPTIPTTNAGKAALNVTDSGESKISSTASLYPFTTIASAQSWSAGVATSANSQKALTSTAAVKTQISSGSSMGNNNSIKY